MKSFFKIFSVSFLFLTIVCFLLPASAFAEVFISQNITEDTIWTKAQSPYLVLNKITVSREATLTVEPGVVVKFKEDSSIKIFGSINAMGNQTDKIVFTSYYDDEYGGNTDWAEESFEDTEEEESTPTEATPQEGNNETEEEESTPTSSAPQEGNSDEPEEIENIIPQAGDWKEIYIEQSENSSFDNIVIRYAKYAMTIYNSEIDIRNIDVEYGFTAFDVNAYSLVKAFNINIRNMIDDSIVLYENSLFEIENLSIENTDADSAIVLFNKAFLSVENINIKNGTGSGIVLFNESTIDLANGEISGFDYAGIEDYEGDESWGENKILLSKIEIKDNDYGLAIYSDKSIYGIEKSSIYDNKLFGIESYSSLNYDFSGIWWGDKTGPYNELFNGEGLGNKVTDNIIFEPFLTAPPSDNIPLIIIPGITGSYLYKDYDDKEEIWPNLIKMIVPLDDNYLSNLALDTEGKENINFPIQVGDIIRNAKLDTLLIKKESHVFDYFINYFLENGYTEDVDLFVFPYDWRFGNTDTALLLNRKINRIMLDTGAEKVDIVSHSMGGIVAKTLIKDYGSEKINKIVFLGTPHLGAPKGAKTLLYGDDMGIKTLYESLSILNPNRIKIISQNMPSIYELMPGKKYFEKAGEYLANINKNLFGNESITPLGYTQSKILLKEKELNQNMIDSAESLHDSIDGIDFKDIDVTNISACGSPTIGKIEISPEIQIGPFKKKEDFRVKFTNGDTTVPLGSANGTDAKGRYFVDGVSHGTMPSAGSVPSFVYKIIKDQEVALGGDFGDTEGVCNKIEGDVLSKHSPINIHIYDESDNHAGPDENGDIQNNIDGVVYETIGDTSFIFLPKGKNFKIVGDATADGEFDLAIESISGDDVLSTKYWQDVEININSKIKMEINTSDDDSDLLLDLAGDGNFETKLSEYETLDKNESYLDFAYQKFIDENQVSVDDTAGGKTFGYLLKKKEDLEIEHITYNPQQLLNTINDIKIFAKNLQVENDNQNKSEINEKQDTGEEVESIQNNPLVASAGNTKIKIRLGMIVFSVSVLLLIIVAIKKYYFKVK